MAVGRRFGGLGACLSVVGVAVGWTAWSRDASSTSAQERAEPALVRVSLKDGVHCAGEPPELRTSCRTGHCKGSFHPSVDDAGHRIAFTSDAEHVSCKAPNEEGWRQVWLRDRISGRTRLVSFDVTTGGAGRNHSDFARISGDGTCVAFSTKASLVPDDDGLSDVYVHTLGADEVGVLERISQGADGRGGDGGSSRPDVSADGRWITFQSRATNLTPSESLRADGEVDQIVLTDRLQEPRSRTTWVSVSEDGTRLARELCLGPRLSASTPPRVVFYSKDDTLARVDANAAEDVHLRDVATGTTRAISVRPDGATASGPSRRPAISADGRWVAFESLASDLVPGRDTNDAWDVFVHDVANRHTVRVSVGIDRNGLAIEATGHSIGAEISADGRVVVFTTGARNLFRDAGRSRFKLCAHDRDADGDGIFDETGPGERRTWCLAPPEGRAANQWSGGTPIAMTRDASFVVFMSEASTLVDDDRNGAAELNPSACCRRRGWPAARVDGPEACVGSLVVPPCEWGRDVFLVALDGPSPRSAERTP